VLAGIFNELQGIICRRMPQKPGGKGGPTGFFRKVFLLGIPVKADTGANSNARTAGNGRNFLM